MTSTPPVLTIIADMRVAAALPWVVLGIALAIAVWCCVGFVRVRGTTLAAPAAWCIVSALTVACVQGCLSLGNLPREDLSSSIWQYFAAVGTCCPLMAVLGAKRPQDRGWQWVVLSLWITLLVPAVQAMAASAADKFEPFITWRLLVAGLIGMGLLNYLLTRFAIAAIFFAIGQTLLMSDYLLHFSANVELMRFFGYVGGPAMILVACAVAEFLHSRPPSDGLHPLSHRWLTFRDGWGAFWGLRVMHRVNQTAELSGWPVRLDWQGFVTASGDLSVSPMIDAATAAQMQQTLDSLLRRFERP